MFLLDLLINGDQISNPRSSCLCSCSWLMKRVGTKSKPSLENDQERILNPMEYWNVR
ncbi:hypothetical protein PanWU01x14_227380, partial [Parasponia andersonii]